MSPDHTISADHRAVLAAVADVLIPASETMPSASEAGVAGELLDGLLKVRPDLVEPLQVVLDVCCGREPEEAVAALRTEDAAGFDTLTFVVAGGYLMDRRVGGLLGYPGQEAKQVDPYDYVDVIDSGLLQPVIDRGPIYRPTPVDRRPDAEGQET